MGKRRIAIKVKCEGSCGGNVLILTISMPISNIWVEILEKHINGMRDLSVLVLTTAHESIMVPKSKT